MSASTLPFVGRAVERYVNDVATMREVVRFVSHPKVWVQAQQCGGRCCFHWRMPVELLYLQLGGPFYLVLLSTIMWTRYACHSPVSARCLANTKGTMTLIPRSMLAHWFVEKRGRAYAVLNVGIFTSSVVFPPLLTGLIGTVTSPIL